MQVEIKHRDTGAAIYTAELLDNTHSDIAMRAALQQAVLRGADLRGAYLRGADLRGAYLRGAYLYGADLYGADLRGAYLYGADLRGADLYGANLRGADLSGAGLGGADLRGADLRGAYLSGEKLINAPVSVLNLRWDVLITEQYMRIGCQRHTHADWAAFDDHAIVVMDHQALRFWRQWREGLLMMCKSHAQQ